MWSDLSSDLHPDVKALLASGAIVWRYLRDPTFSRFDTIPDCDTHTHTHTNTHAETDGHTTTAYTSLSIESRGKNDTDLYLSLIHI